MFTKRELQAQIDTVDSRIDKLKYPSATIEEGEANRTDLQKLTATRSELLEKLAVAPE